MNVLSSVPRWALFTGALLVPALAFAASNAPSGVCALFGFGCCGG